jgi:hypothetical protein
MLISVRLYIQGDDLDPAEITELLRVQPSRAHRRGEPRTLPGGRLVHEQIGVWVWKTGVDAPDAHLEDCLGHFLSTFSPVRAHLGSLPNSQACWVDIHVVEERSSALAGSEVAVVFTPEQTEALGALRLPIEITVSTVDQDE